MIVPASPQAQANPSGNVGSQAFCVKNTTGPNSTAASTPPPIFSAAAPIKPQPDNYVNMEDFTLVRKSTRLPTAKGVNKYGGTAVSVIINFTSLVVAINATAIVAVQPIRWWLPICHITH